MFIFKIPYKCIKGNKDVFFDNLQVTHSRGALLEENSYYPFGLAMHGISNKSAGKLENRYKFNSATELNSDFDINLYETPLRGYDPQIGRFHQIDPHASSYTSESPYSFAFNNPVNFNDPLGLDPPQNAPGLLDYIEENGIAGFGDGLTSYTFGNNGEMTGYYYTSSPEFVTNSHGDIGLYVNYAYHLDNGNSQGFGSAVMDEIVIGRQFVNLSVISSAGNGNSDALVNSQTSMYNPFQIGMGPIQTGFEYAQYTETGIGITQLGMIAYRQSLPITSKIGNFSPFLSTYTKLSFLRNTLGKAGNLGAGVEIYANYTQATLPDSDPNKISWERFGYRTTGTLSSIVASSAIGAQFGGHWGAVAGGMVGLGFAAGEKAYDGYNYSVKEISKGVTDFENGINKGWMPRW